MDITLENIRYVYENEEAVNKRLKCTICVKPLIEPVSTNCEPKPHTFCRGCIEKWIRLNQSCPSCEQNLHIENLTSIRTVSFNDMLDDIPVRCLGCKQADLRRVDFDAHYSEKCPKAIVKCPLSDIMCSWMGTRDELEGHLKTCDIHLIAPFIIACVTRNQQLQGIIHQQQTEIERLKDDKKHDRPLDYTVNHEQTLDTRSMKDDQHPSNILSLQQLIDRFNKPNPTQSQFALLNQENRRLKEQLDKQQKYIDQRNSTYTYGAPDNSHSEHTATGNHGRINHAAFYTGRNATHNPPPSPRDHHLHNSPNDSQPIHSTPSNNYQRSDTTENPPGSGAQNVFNTPITLSIIIPVPTSVNTNISNGTNNNLAGVNNSNNATGGHNNVSGGSYNNIAAGNNNNIVGSNNNPAGNNNYVGGINDPVRNNNAGEGNNNIAGGSFNNIANGNDNNIAGSNDSFAGNHNNIVGGNNHFAGNYNNIPGGNNYNGHHGRDDTPNDADSQYDTNESVTSAADNICSNTSSIDGQIRQNPDTVIPPNANNHRNSLD